MRLLNLFISWENLSGMKLYATIHLWISLSLGKSRISHLEKPLGRLSNVIVQAWKSNSHMYLFLLQKWITNSSQHSFQHLTHCALLLWGRCCSSLWSSARRREGRTWPCQSTHGTRPCSQPGHHSSHGPAHQEYLFPTLHHKIQESVRNTRHISHL